MARAQLERLASQLVRDDSGSDGSDCQSFLSQLWQQTQQAAKAPPAKPPAPPEDSPAEQDARARYSHD